MVLIPNNCIIHIGQTFKPLIHQFLNVNNKHILLFYVLETFLFHKMKYTQQNDATFQPKNHCFQMQNMAAKLEIKQSLFPTTKTRIDITDTYYNGLTLS